jgi:hypothetical protein
LLNATGDGSKAVHAHVSVMRNDCGAKQPGKLTGGRTPKQIHLKEAILSMKEAEGACHIQAVGTANRRDAEVVALHANGCRESWQ